MIEEKKIHVSLKSLTSKPKSTYKAVAKRAKDKMLERTQVIDYGPKSITFHGDTFESFRTAECFLSLKKNK